MEDKKVVSLIDRYLKRHAFSNQLIDEKPSSKLGQIVIIPAFEEDSLIPTLESLYACEKPKCALEVIVVFNASEHSETSSITINQKARLELEEWYSSLSQAWFKIHTIEQNNLPAKHAGVGLARKIGMDEAVRRFLQLGRDGLLICFDADSRCHQNYLTAIEQHFEIQAKTPACSIYFEHPTAGKDFDSEVYEGIVAYELHLRYYKQALAFVQLPYAFHTVGSSMAVKASAYCKQGGMNKRKAGEDFYFLQKFIKSGNFTELNSSTVIPSPRPSHRVPFGTGRSIAEMQQNKRQLDESYAWENVLLLKEVLLDVGKWYTAQFQAHPLFEEFYGREKWLSSIEQIRANSTSLESFRKRFFNWFDAFQCLKFMHFLRDTNVTQKPLIEEVPKLLEASGLMIKEKHESHYSLLMRLREIDQKGLI